MELRHLRYFVAVAEERHFGRAAERLHMAQPPLSQQIRQLEKEVGAELLRRTTRRVQLTRAGMTFLTRARAVLSDIDAAANEARRVAAGSIGHLTLGCVGSATYSLLPELSRALSTELPGIDFSFRGEMLAPDQIDALRTGQIDVALLRPPVADLSLTVTVLRQDRLVVAIPTGHPLAQWKQLSPADLVNVDLIIHSADRRSTMYEVVLRLLRDSGVEPHIRHEVGETSTLVTLVAGGLGLAVVPEPVTALPLSGVTYRPLRSPTVGLAVAYRHDRTEPHLARTIDVIRNTVTGDRASDHPG